MSGVRRPALDDARVLASPTNQVPPTTDSTTRGDQ